jgi:hypothetical protein
VDVFFCPLFGEHKFVFKEDGCRTIGECECGTYISWCNHPITFILKPNPEWKADKSQIKTIKEMLKETENKKHGRT